MTLTFLSYLSVDRIFLPPALTIEVPAELADIMLHNPNNWHWVNKDARAWAKEYLSQKVCALSAEDNGASAKIERLAYMDGDVDVNQRKGKVIALFDVTVRLEYQGLLSATMVEAVETETGCR